MVFVKNISLSTVADEKGALPFERKCEELLLTIVNFTQQLFIFCSNFSFVGT